MKVAVVGTGYVGLVHGVVLAEMGHEVVCVDNDPAKLEKLRNGVSPIYEPGVEEILARTLANGSFRVSPSVAEGTRHGEIVFIAVGTPPGPDGTPDTTAVQAVAREIGGALESYTVVVNKSTVPIGAGDMVEEIILKAGADPALFDVVSNPEFLREGSAVWDTQNPDRVVIGAKKPEAASRLLELYAPMGTPTLVTDLNSAEMIKYASNSYLATKISFINAIARVCELCGADVGDVAKGMGMDQRIGSQFLQAGLGWGGSCFPKDVAGLIQIAGAFGYDFGLLKASEGVNSDQTPHFLRRLETHLGGFEGKTIAVLGLSFKPNTDDIRDAKSIEAIRILKAGGAKVRAHDPIAMPMVAKILPEVEYLDDPYAIAVGADAALLVTEWEVFKKLDFERFGNSMRGKVLFDGRRAIARERAEAAGFHYETIGS